MTYNVVIFFINLVVCKQICESHLQDDFVWIDFVVYMLLCCDSLKKDTDMTAAAVNIQPALRQVQGKAENDTSLVITLTLKLHVM